jgi:peptide/nickel transport system substrate-binding protein
MANASNHLAKGRKIEMRDVKAISKMVIAVILIVVIVVVGVIGYYLAVPPITVKDTLQMGTTDSVESCLDPARAYDFFGFEIIQSLGSPLVEYKAGATGLASDIQPALATSWSSSADGLTWAFDLRQGVHFDDGTEFTAEAVKYTFERGIQIADPDGAWVGIGIGDIIDSVQVVSTYQVQFNLKISFAAFLSLIAGQECYIVDPTYAPKAGDTWSIDDVVLYQDGNPRGSNPMGLGPYTLQTWTRVAGKDTAMTLAANPNYWGNSSGLPKTQTIIIRFYDTSSALALAMTAGDVDIAFRQLATTDINSMKTNSAVKVWEAAGPFIQYLCMQENMAPFDNVVARQAVGAAINRSAIVQTVFQGEAQPLYSMIPTGMLGSTNAFASLGDPNYTKTQELLATLGYDENNKLTFTLWYETSGHYPQSQQQALVLQDSLQKSGVITVNLEGRDWAAYRTARQDEIMQAYILGWYPDYIDPDDYIQPFVQSSGGSWLHMNYANPEMDSLVEQARSTTDSATRTSLYEQINNLMVQDVPIIPLYMGNQFAASKPNVQGIYLDITQNWRNWLVYETE